MVSASVAAMVINNRRFNIKPSVLDLCPKATLLPFQGGQAVTANTAGNASRLRNIRGFGLRFVGKSPPIHSILKLAVAPGAFHFAAVVARLFGQIRTVAQLEVSVTESHHCPGPTPSGKTPHGQSHESILQSHKSFLLMRPIRLSLQ